MSERKKRNRWVLVSLVFLCAAPFLLAWVLFYNPQWLSGRTNYGNLIIPPVPIPRTEFIGLDAFSRGNLEEMKGHWVLLQVVTDQGCHGPCKDALHKTKQIRLMLNKDLLRIRRFIVIGTGIDAQQARKWWQEDDHLLRVRPGKTLIERLTTAIGQPLVEGMVFVMDPFGNLMMWYGPGFDPYGVKKDLKRLLNVSQIG